jgi:beta-glucosidase
LESFHTQRAAFLWGTATSSYQVEGKINNNDWNVFTSTKSIKRRIFKMTKPSIFYKSNLQRINLRNAGDACKMWERDYYLHDFDLAKSLGMNALKISLEWARIEPRIDEWDEEALAHYLDMIRAMKSRGLIPIIALNHLTLPEWVLTPPSEFKNKVYQYFLPSPLRDLPIGEPPTNDPYWQSLRGWENYKTVEAFIRYVKRVVEYLKNEVDYWITLGEPVASIVGGGYLAGIYPPGFFLDGNKAKDALHNLIEAHVQSYDVISVIDDVDADDDSIAKKVGISQFMVTVSPARSNMPFGMGEKQNNEAAENFCYFINDYFLNAIIYGEEDLNYLETLQKSVKSSNRFVVREKWKNKVDFIGLNYYRRVHICFSRILSLSSARFLGGVFQNRDRKNSPDQSTVNDLGWEIFPQGLYEILKFIKNKWNKPILITENGVADASDRLRAPFIIAHLQQVKRAIDESIDVIGYLHWSLMDNYEWIEGYRPEGKFGLFYIDHERLNDQNLNRKITKGAQALKLIIEESFLDNKNGLITDKVLSKAKERYDSFSSDGVSYTKPMT